MSELLYPQLDAEQLGEWYFRHVEAMTQEKLHLKSDIAAQLAWRDKELMELRAACKEWIAYFDELNRFADPDDPLVKARNHFHGPRVERTRAALALGEPPAATEGRR